MKNPKQDSIQIEQYDTASVEKKWANKWKEEKIYEVKKDRTKKKFYCLDTWSYPSADGVHIGYVKSFGGMDIIARYKRMKGFNVLYPAGWDSFGLPAENYAIKTGIHPRKLTRKSISHYKQQYHAFGLSYDWSRELDTADPQYYKWTQWIFLVMHERGLAYKKRSKINWCPNDLTVLAKEQVIDGKCERCGAGIEEKELEQWHFKVSDYAERLHKDADKLDWDKSYLNMHKSWVHPDHLQDWCVSRQRYWGPPIPIIYCDKCGIVPISISELPLILPYDVNYTPTGKPPLAGNSDFVNTKCPNCKGKARREVDTLDTFVSSGWYEYRFTDPYNEKEFASKENLDYWMNVDHYQGLAEHFTAHLVYARFITKVLYDAGYVKDDEPFPKYTAVGILVDKDGRKFSKRYNNAPDTDGLVEKYGGDLLRMSCAFIGPFTGISKWGEQDVVGVNRFRDKIWRIFKTKVAKSSPSEGQKNARLHRIIKDVEDNIQTMKYNVALSKMIVFVDDLDHEEQVDRKIWEIFTKLLAPFAPFIAEEMWNQMGYKTSIHKETFPKYSEDLIRGEKIKIAIQIDGKTKGNIRVKRNLTESAVFTAIKKTNIDLPLNYNVKFVKNRIINFVSQ